MDYKDLVWSESGYIINARKHEIEGRFDEYFVSKDSVEEGVACFCKYNFESFWKSEKDVIEMILDMGYAEGEELKLIEKRLKDLGE